MFNRTRIAALLVAGLAVGVNAQIGVRIVRADGETVLEGEAWCYTARP